jgi:hypothetical protein
MTEKLEAGKFYSVTESCGMLILKGKFLGIAQRGSSDSFLVFENVTNRKNSYKYFGAKWRINVSYRDATRPEAYLCSTHYGTTIENLKPVTEGDLSVKFQPAS